MAARLLAVFCCILVTASSTSVPESTCTVEGKVVKEGEQHDLPGHCAYNVCKGNNEWALAPCGLIGQPEGWEIEPEDTSKPFPTCCGAAKPPLDIVPDVLSNLTWSGSYLQITYDGDVKVENGKELTPTQVKNEPKVEYNADPNGWYVLCMTDPDAPSRKEPKAREFLHWLVGNIPGTDVSAGETLAQYVGSGPPLNTGLHRYVFLVYKQPGKLTFDEPRLTNTSPDHRRNFSIQKFAQKYNLTTPPTVNLFQAQYDDYVPVVHKQLGLKV